MLEFADPVNSSMWVSSIYLSRSVREILYDASMKRAASWRSMSTPTTQTDSITQAPPQTQPPQTQSQPQTTPTPQSLQFQAQPHPVQAQPVHSFSQEAPDSSRVMHPIPLSPATGTRVPGNGNRIASGVFVHAGGVAMQIGEGESQPQAQRQQPVRQLLPPSQYQVMIPCACAIVVSVFIEWPCNWIPRLWLQPLDSSACL